ncbi:MAG: VOC family protein [Terracidiphilus sp.]|jgi:catechol 2,3-dioxygenase-like lactoylglutathione lyase family enzyme
MEQSDYKLTQVSVVMLGVHDLTRSLEFYHERLGLKVQREIPGFAFLDAGAVTLCLSEPAAKVRGQVAGAGEVVFSVEDVTAAYQALLGKGVQFTHEPRSVTPATRVANFDDPDGNHLSIYGL